MSKIFIVRRFEASDQASIFLEGPLNAAGDAFQATSLHIDRVRVELAPTLIPISDLVPIGSHFKFDAAATFSLDHEVALASDFLGLLKAGAKLRASISSPPAGAPSAFLKVVVSGDVAIDLGPFSGLDKLTYQLTLDEVPFDLVTIPKLDLSFSRFKLPTLRLPGWHLPDFPNTPVKLEGLRIQSDRLPFNVGWGKLTVRVDSGPKSTLEFEQLEITTPHLKALKVAGDLKLVFQGGNLSTESKLRRSSGSEIGLSNLSIHEQRYTFSLLESDMSLWFASLMPNAVLPKVGAKVTVQVAIGADTIRQIRVDWKEDPVVPGSRSFGLPGLTIGHSVQPLYTLFLDADAVNASKLAFCWTLEKDDAFTAQSNFAWQRENERELHNDAGGPPLFTFKAMAPQKSTLVVLQTDISTRGLPRFFQQLDPPLEELTSASPAVVIVPKRLDASDGWKLEFDLPTTPLALPFLRRTEGLPQSLEITRSETESVTVTDNAIKVPFKVTVKVGNILLDALATLDFDWETFALKVDHERGIRLTSDKESVTAAEELFGLKWRFRGREIAANIYHYFTLVTHNFNYQLQQAPGAVFQIDYKELSSDSLTFEVSDFVLTPNGINLRATANDEPVRLNGVNTKFRFGGSGFEIRENQINDFTLTGSGPLPPDLVGEATVDVALQFRQEGAESALKLAAGHAELKGKKPLKCAQTRFEFEISAIGLRFIEENRGYHLYFVLTGTAAFKLAPNDDPNGPLALLSKIKIELVECPLTGDASVIARRVRFLVELPSPKSFNFFGCFEMELRGIGFLPQADVFGGDGAMQLTGQVKFVQGLGDAPDSRVDYHTLFIGVPGPGSLFPRLSFSDLPVNINVGEAFRLNGSVELINKADQQGFTGDGTLQIQGLPTMAAAFGFLRVRRDANSPWLRAWFIYLEVRKVSFMIPVIQIYIREIGLGFGYRYTILSIKAADEAKDIRALVKELKALSRTQGDLAKRDRWAVDLGKPGEDPSWTIVFRAMISQTSASALLTYNDAGEQNLSCLFLFDAVAALRSDLTFFIAARGWLMTNYDEFLKNPGLRERPLFSGFVLLSPRQKRFLAHLASNPDGELGSRPGLPDFVKEAIKSCQFSATLLIEPGLLHYELGWPDMLRWKMKLGPLIVEARGGFIFRITGDELVIGNSFLARGSLDIGAEVHLGFIGVRASAHADVAYGARYIGCVNFSDPLGKSALYAAVGLEIHVSLSIEAWIHIDLFLTSIDLSFSFSIAIGFTAGLELGFDGLNPGLRGYGTISLSVCGHDLQLNVRLAANESAVDAALNRTSKYLKMGLEATEVEKLPGVEARQAFESAALGLAGVAALERAAPFDAMVEAPGSAGFAAPNYHLFVVRRTSWDGFDYMVLFPGSAADGNGAGFFPVPPEDISQETTDIEVTFPNADRLPLEQFVSGQFTAMTGPNGSLRGVSKVKWRGEYRSVTGAYPQEGAGNRSAPEKITFAQYLSCAFKVEKRDNKIVPLGDPEPLPISSESDRVRDERVYNPSDAAFEAAVRGAVEQFEGSPFFKKDSENVVYDKLLESAFESTTTIYSNGGSQRPANGSAVLSDESLNRQAHQTRGAIVNEIIADVLKYVEEPDEDKREEFVKTSIPFAMGLVFRFKDARIQDDFKGEIRQRVSRTEATLSEKKKVTIYNLSTASFETNPPGFRRVQHYTNATTIAIAWDLEWPDPPAGTSPSQGDPEQHLMHYRVLRRAIGSGENDLVITVKPAEVLHREAGPIGGDVLKRLQPRFKVVDHFKDETADDQALLPIGGRTYLYTITPRDLSGNYGRSITVRATRFPSEPPLAPATGEFIVDYELESVDFEPHSVDPAGLPELLEPAKVRVRWSEQALPSRKPPVAIASYRLILRKSSTVPIGSYGLDSSTRGSPNRLLPTSNARKLPTDVEISLEIKNLQQTREDGDLIRETEIGLDLLTKVGVLPTAGGPLLVRRWRAESWRIYLQAVSVGGVRSALAPVQIKLNARMRKGAPTAIEQRTPAEMEWLPRPLKAEFLRAEDSNARTGPVHVPMPTSLLFSSPPGQPMIEFRPHPHGIRCIEFRWNQGSSEQPRKLFELNAGYRIYELDVDSHTAETFKNRERLTEALRFVREIEMLPSDELALAPRETTNPSQWEAWYPSQLIRLSRQSQPENPAGGESKPILPPWFSWRESMLELPRWPGLTTDRKDETSSRDGELHVFLREFLSALRENPAKINGLQQFAVDLQGCPPMQQSNFASFMASTAAKSDPYGWGVLQRLGLSIAFSLRANDGNVVTGDALLRALDAVLKGYKEQPLDFVFPATGIDLLPVEAALGSDAKKGVETALEALKGKQFYGRRSLDLALKKSLGATLLERAVNGTQTLGAFVLSKLTHTLHFKDFYQYLFLELLVQPGRSVSLAQGSFGNDGLLATVQLSLRPIAVQTLKYHEVTIKGPKNSDVEVSFGDEKFVSVVSPAEEENRDNVVRTRQDDLDPNEKLKLRLSAKGEAVCLVRSRNVPTITIESIGNPTAIFSHEAEPFEPTDEHARSAKFTIKTEILAHYFKSDPNPNTADIPEAVQWRRIKCYLEALNANDPGLDAASKINLSLHDEEKIKADLPQFLTWSQRFFDAGIELGEAKEALPELGESTGGPWLATAYPRSVSPTPATPDDFGRLTFHHLLPDDWAHNYRFAIRIQRRYDLLWDSFRQSRILFPEGPGKTVTLFLEPAAGGLDVVIDRKSPSRCRWSCVRGA